MCTIHMIMGGIHAMSDIYIVHVFYIDPITLLHSLFVYLAH